MIQDYKPTPLPLQAEVEEERRADEIRMAEIQAEEKKRSNEIQIQMAQIEAAKDLAEIKTEIELALKELEL